MATGKVSSRQRVRADLKTRRLIRILELLYGQRHYRYGAWIESNFASGELRVKPISAKIMHRLLADMVAEGWLSMKEGGGYRISEERRPFLQFVNAVAKAIERSEGRFKRVKGNR